MYNLLMKCDSDQTWWKNNNIYEENRLFEYTNEKVKAKYKDDLDKLKDLPCLFTYERYSSNSKIKGHIGQIKSIKRKETSTKGLDVIIEYSLDKEYPIINIDTNNPSELLTLGIDDSKLWELGRTHWAVKNKNLFEFLAKYFARKIENEPILTSNEMKNVWGENHENKARIFFSHKANHKDQISDIKKKLEKENFSCFVAHEDIEPSLEWPKEIIKALNTMDIFIGIVTDDFHTGSWTDQEIGFAYKRDIPKIFIKLEGINPKGFVSLEQALVQGVTWKNAHEKIISHIKKHYPNLYNPCFSNDTNFSTDEITNFISHSYSLKNEN